MKTKAFLALAIFSLLAAACTSGSHEILPSPSGGAAYGGNALRSQHSARESIRIVKLGKPHVFLSRTYYERHPAWVASLRGHARRFRPNAASNLLYKGGPVQTAPKIYLVFWGISSTSDTTHDPDGLASYLINFFSSIPASTWLNTDTQYYQGSSSKTYIANPGTQYAGAYFDSTLPPSTVYTGNQIATEAAKGAAHFGYKAGVSANFIVVSATSYTTKGFVTDCPASYGGNCFCGYHTASYMSSGGMLAYTILPYTPDAGGGCGAGSVTSPGTLDGASIVGGHEEAETQTDPNASSGWLDSSGQEIGDKCAWTNLQNTAFPNGQSFPTQPLWSNASSSCVQSFGSVATPTPGPSSTPTTTPSSTPYPTPTPTQTPTPAPTNVVVNPGFETGSLSPWKSCASSGVTQHAVVTRLDPHSGTFDAFAGTPKKRREPNGLLAVCQQVTIPAGGTLTVWIRGVSNDRSKSVMQFGALYLTNGHLAKTLFVRNHNDAQWVQTTSSLSSLAGGTYYLAFGIVGNARDRLKHIGLFVDDVSLTGTAARGHRAIKAPSAPPTILDLP